MFSPKPNANLGNEKIKILKLEHTPIPQLKRRRSHSHNGAELSNNEFFSSNGNSQYFVQTHKESSPIESSQVKQIINNSNSPYMNNQLIKDKHKKETHNRVERKRRDFINCQIQKLADLLPTEFFLNCDLKMNKGVILKNSVEYITSMKLVDQINHQLVQENELGAKLIRSLISSNELNCSQLSINDNFSHTELNEDVDIGILVNQWFSVHQENKQLMQQFNQRLSPLSNNRDTFKNFNDDATENVFVNDSKNNNSLVSTPIPCRKRYSSLPTNISPNFQSQRNFQFQNSNVQLISDKSSPILNSLLKKSNQHNFAHNETLEPLYRIDSNEEVLDFYVRYSASPIAGQTIDTDNALIINTSNTESEKDCKLFYSKDKTYYIMPKSIKPEFTAELEEHSIENSTDKLLDSIDRNDQFIQTNDPMLLSTSPLHP